MKKHILFSVIALLLSATIGCEKDEEKTVNRKIYGTWKCVGFGNTQTDKITPIEPQNSEKCYIITFKKDGTMSGYSSTNELKGNYEVSNNNQCLFTSFGGTKRGEIGDGDLFWKRMRLVSFYEIKKEKLSLFYSKTEYLLFNFKNK